MKLYEIMAKLKQHGYRLTPQRRTIVEKILQQQAVFTVAEIWQLVRDEYTEVGLDTVYRNINVLTEIGILHAITGTGNDSTRYELVEDDGHHHHIVCVKCGHAACLDYCPINKEFEDMVRRQGYELLRHNMELLGVCLACQDKENDACLN